MFSFRRAADADMDGIKDLLGSCGLPYQDIAPSSGILFMVAESEGRLAGVCGAEVRPDAVLLRSLAVFMSFRNKGLGRMLAREIMKEAAGENRLPMFILTLTAENYLAKLGFRRIPREDVPESIRKTGQFRGVCPKTAISMIYSTEAARPRSFPLRRSGDDSGESA